MLQRSCMLRFPTENAERRKAFKESPTKHRKRGIQKLKSTTLQSILKC